ncbi:MAG: YeeE/YedE family protein [Gammaproteobacteria bacterium]|nr:YeeE/YedE family protein [Gammaproteobacteria bacterium]
MTKSYILISSGLMMGLFFGVLLRHYRVCLVAAISHWVLLRNHRYMVTIVAAALVAILATQLLEISGTVAIANTSYRDGVLDWLGAIYGGLMFGIGAALAGGDAARTVIRAGEGSFTGIVVLIVFMLSAYMAQYGWLEPARLWVTAQTSITLVGGDTGLAPLLGISKWLPLLIISALLLIYLVRVWKQHGEVALLVIGILFGAVVIPAWYISGVVTVDEFAPEIKPTSLTVVGALSRIGSVVLLKGVPEASIPIFFVIGLFLASLIYSLLWRRWEFSRPQTRTLVTAVIGAVLMGIGGTVSYGCNIGQGISGLSTLSVESLLAVAAIFCGVWLGTLVLGRLRA